MIKLLLLTVLILGSVQSFAAENFSFSGMLEFARAQGRLPGPLSPMLKSGFCFAGRFREASVLYVNTYQGPREQQAQLRYWIYRKNEANQYALISEMLPVSYRGAFAISSLQVPTSGQVLRSFYVTQVPKFNERKNVWMAFMATATTPYQQSTETACYFYN